MAILRKLRPTELVRLLNSTPLGEVISERQFLRHRDRCRYSVSATTGRSIFSAYVAWLVAVRHEPESPSRKAIPMSLLKDGPRS